MPRQSQTTKHGSRRLSLRQATEADIPALRIMGRKFYDKVQPEWPWSQEGDDAVFRLCIENGFASISEGAMLLGIVQPYILNPEWVVAHELFMWAEDKSALRHMKAFREWARANNVDEIQWSCRADNDRVQRFYSRFAKLTSVFYSEVL